jgi:peptidyl-prolyl cis-trans isomerase B (cyclophilin B)
MIRPLVTLIALLAVVAAPALAQAPAPAEKKAPATEKKVPAKASTAVITLEKGGEIVLEFWPADAPKHVQNFVKLANDKFYDGQRVHRVEPNFVVQFGDPQSKTLPMNDPKMGSGGPGYTIKAEFNDTSHKRGTLSMARSSDPNSAGSQFFICVADASFLDRQYSAFGTVVRGMEVADKIVNAPRDNADNPNNRIEMKVRVVETA